jgi:hypothetical protein
MPVISSLQAGLKVNSTGNSLNTGEIRLSDANGLFPIYSLSANNIPGPNGNIQTGNGQLMTGGAYLTINPSAGLSGSVATLMKGQALTLAIEYNSSNQFRFDLTPAGATTSAMISSPWLAVGTEHSVGVSYDTTSGLTVLSVDGASQSSFVAYTTTGTTLPTITQYIGTNSGALSAAPTYNGFIDQVVIFNQAPGAATLNSMTSDPVSANAALASQTAGQAGHLETQTVSFGTILNAAAPAVASATALNIGAKGLGVQVGDVVTNLTTPGTSTVVTAIAANGALTIVNTGGAIATTDSLLFTHPNALSSTTTGSALETATTINNTGMTVNSTAITLASGTVTGIMVGDWVSGFNIPAGDTVSQINPINGTITLATPVGSAVIAAGTEQLTFVHPSAAANVTSSAQATIANGTATVTNLGSVAGIEIGDIAIPASGTGIPSNDHVIAINVPAGTVTLGQNTTVAATGVINFVHSTYTSATPTAGAATSVLTIPANTAIQVGDIVNDPNQVDGYFTNEVVTAVNATGTSVTLSANSVNPIVADSVNFTHTTSTSTTGSGTAASATLIVANGAGIQQNDILVDVTNPINAVNVKNITVKSVSGNTITLNSNVLTSFTNDTLTFVHPPAVTASPATTVIPPATTGTTVTTLGYQLATSNNSLLYLNSTNGIQSGDYVFGPNIPVGDMVSSTAPTANSVTLTTATNLLVAPESSLTFVHPNSPNIQVVAINSTNTAAGKETYKAGDTITITAPATANTFASATYTVANSDISTLPATTLSNIAKSFANANPTIGAFSLIYNKDLNNQIELVPNTGTAQVLPLATVTSTDSAGLNENTLTNFYNFANTKTAQLTTAGANGGTAATLDSSGTLANTTSVATVSYATTAATAATPQAHGPVYAELVSLNGTTAVYNLFVDGSLVPSGTLNNVGMTINVPSTQASITNITPSAGGTISQVNNSGTGSISYQWASNAGVTNFTAPIGQLTLSLTSNAVNSIAATMTNLSVNSTNFKDPVQNLPMLETSTLNSQVYTVSGHFYDQFNSNGASGTNNQGTPWGQFTTQVALANNDFSYTVAGSTVGDLKLSVEQNNLSAVSKAAPNASIALDLVATSMPAAWSTAKAMPFTVTMNVPSNATGVNFTPGTGVTLTSGATTVGHTLTLTGTYSAPSGKGAVGTSAPTLGVLSATLTNEFNNGGQFSMDTVSINGNAAVGQSLYFGMGEADASGAYSISNLPAGKLAISPFNNVSAINPSKITVSGVMAVMSIAAGKGMPGGVGQPIGATANLLPSDFVAADYNQDGQVTAADALSMLNYIVSVNKANTPGFTYMSATGNAVINTPESTTAVVVPALTAQATNLSPSNAALVTGDSSKIIDIVGVLPGYVVNY